MTVLAGSGLDGSLFVNKAAVADHRKSWDILFQAWLAQTRVDQPQSVDVLERSQCLPANLIPIPRSQCVPSLASGGHTSPRPGQPSR